MLLKKRNTFIAILLCGLFLSACIGDSDLVPIDNDPERGTAGFFYGLLHGFFFYIQLFQQISGSDVSVYDIYHGNLYDVGFITGLGIGSNILRQIVYFPFVNRKKWVKGVYAAISSFFIGGLFAWFFTDPSSIHYTPATWPKNADQGDGIIMGVWHALISPWMSIVNVFGYDSSLISSQNTSYLIPFAFISFVNRGKKKKDKDANEENVNEQQ